jgi:hypothetical protein
MPDNTKKTPWFNQMKMDSFNDFIAAWVKQTDTIRITKSKHHTQFEDIKAGAQALNAINDSLTYRNKTNPDGSIQINPDTLKVEFNPALADPVILDNAILKIRNAAIQIMKQSEKLYAPGTNLGGLAQGVINICNDFEKFHKDTKKDITKIAFKDFYKNNQAAVALPEKYTAANKSINNSEWFDSEKIDHMQIVIDKLKSRFADKPESEKIIKGLEANLAALTAINTAVINDGVFKRDAKGGITNSRVEVMFSDKLDDPEISGAANNLLTQKDLLTALNTYDKSDTNNSAKNEEIKQENAKLIAELANYAGAIFKNHREKKQDIEENFLKDFYQENYVAPPQVEISIAKTTVKEDSVLSENNDSVDHSRNNDSIDYSSLQIDIDDDITPLPSQPQSPRSSVTASPELAPSPMPVAKSIPPSQPAISPATLAPLKLNNPERVAAIPAQQAPAKASEGTSWFKYALITAGIVLGAAAIATGLGAVVGVPLLAVSIGSLVYSALSSERGSAFLDRVLGIPKPTDNTPPKVEISVNTEPTSQKSNQSTLSVLSVMKNFEDMKTKQQNSPPDNKVSAGLATAKTIVAAPGLQATPAPTIQAPSTPGTALETENNYQSSRRMR